MLELNKNEILVIRDLTRPSSFDDLYKNIKEIEDLDSQVGSLLEKSNYSNITAIYNKKKGIKNTLIKNQLSRVAIYEKVLTSEINKNNLYSIDLNYTLASILLNILVVNSLIIEGRARKKEITVADKNRLITINNIINRISTEYEAERLLNSFDKTDIEIFKSWVV